MSNMSRECSVRMVRFLYYYFKRRDVKWKLSQNKNMLIITDTTCSYPYYYKMANGKIYREYNDE